MMKSKHILYRSYTRMVSRCYNEKDEKFPIYGQRGIKVCDRWLEDFWNYVQDVGDRPEGTSLDRINNNGDYEPGNVRWATPKEQTDNRDDISFMVWGRDARLNFSQ